MTEPPMQVTDRDLLAEIGELHMLMKLLRAENERLREGGDE